MFLIRSRSDVAKYTINSRIFDGLARFWWNFVQILLPTTIQTQRDSAKKSFFSMMRPKNASKTSSRCHKSKVRKISDRFSAAELFLTPLEPRDKRFLIFSVLLPELLQVINSVSSGRLWPVWEILKTPSSKKLKNTYLWSPEELVKVLQH